MQPLTRIQNKVLQAIKLLMDGTEIAPTQDELARELLLTDSTIRSHLNNLEEFGYIVREHGKRRTLSITTLSERFLFCLDRADALKINDRLVLSRAGVVFSVHGIDGFPIDIDMTDFCEIQSEGDSWMVFLFGGSEPYRITPLYKRPQGEFK